MRGETFINDECKMVDFLILSKEEFLGSYSYLTSADWNATYNDVLKVLTDRGYDCTYEEEIGDEYCKWSVCGECTLMCDDNECDGTPNEMWECAFCGEE